jgi:hypothetical protein
MGEEKAGEGVWVEESVLYRSATRTHFHCLCWTSWASHVVCVSEGEYGSMRDKHLSAHMSLSLWP